MNRRTFLAESTALAVAPWLSSKTLARARGANDRIRAAVMGVGERGPAHVMALLAQPGVEISHICDVDSSRMGAAVREIEKARGKAPTAVRDIRKVLDDRTVDVISIAAPNHWHVLAAIWACQAGKDVYVEKPISQTIQEGRRLVDAARKHGRIVQHGTQNRSNPSVQAAVEFIRAGKLGRVKLARAVNYKLRKGIGKHRGDVPVPATVNYDLWLGPAPQKPLARQRLHYDWHWFWDFGSGDMGNQGVHQLDVALWGLGKRGLPRSVHSAGGRFGFNDDGETPNSQVALFDYGDCRLICEVRNLPSSSVFGAQTGNVWYGTEGYIVRDLRNGNSCRAYLGKKKEPVALGEAKVDLDVLDRLHFANFLAAVRSRRSEDLHADAETGHYSSALCHLANISYRLGKETAFGAGGSLFADKDEAESFRRLEEHLRANKLDLQALTCRLGRSLEVDAQGETLGDADANALLTRTYRPPFIVPEKV